MRGVALLAALILLVACGEDAPDASDPSGTIVLDDSAVHVLAGSDAIATVRDLEVLDDGSVWVLNTAEPYFVGFDSGGGALEAHGVQGGGPEEVRMPASFVTAGPYDRAWVFDAARRAVIQVSEPEGAWQERALPRPDRLPGSLIGGMDMLDPSPRAAFLGGEILLARTSGSLESGVYEFRLAIVLADLVAVDPESDSVRTLVALSDVLDDPVADFERSDGGFPLWYRLWAVCPGEVVRVYDRAGNVIRGFRGDGTEVEPIPLPPPPFTEVSPREFAHAVYPLRVAEVMGEVTRRLTAADSVRLINETAGGVQGSPDQLAAYLPRYVDMRCSDDGAVWMRPLDLEAGGTRGGRSWLRIDAAGGSREVVMPTRFDPYRFTDDRIWGVARDELDVASVAWVATPETR